MTQAPTAGRAPAGRQVLALVRASHPGPTVAVTALASAYAMSLGQPADVLALVAAAVLAGQLSIGWCNDVVDVARDRQVGRADKPVATGEVPLSVVRAACALALVATVVLSLATGLLAGLVHLVCVAAGWAYDLGLKATALSWVPYAVAFGLLPGFVSLADPGGWPAWSVLLAAALLGVGAHLLNAVPDLADDAATGVRGLPHRLGARRSTVLAVAALGAATLPLVLSVPEVSLAARATVAVLVAGCAVAALTGRGRWPFRAAIAIAALDVVLLVVAA
ncbi:UbiA family prenyltransferase [Nocardioides aestuarii]|uniref:UbiA family prenyltransferase n=1 Tax=Nocardioides aestuarii TaxID=252231 RepID=A0ABW4TI79_9ACTN